MAYNKVISVTFKFKVDEEKLKKSIIGTDAQGVADDFIQHTPEMMLDDTVDTGVVYSPLGSHAEVQTHKPYPWCIGAKGQDKAECILLGHCPRSPTCGD